MPRQDLWTPAKVIKKKNLSGFSSNPSKVASCGISKCIVDDIKGFSKKVFPQLALPKIKMFRYLPRRFSSSSRTALWKLPPDRLFRVRVSSATSNHSPLQLAIHGPSRALCSISILVICFLFNFSSASSISHPTWLASSTTLLPLLAINCAKSSFPSFICREARARSSSLDFIPFATTSLDTSKILRRGAFLFLVFLAVLFAPPRSVVVRLASCVSGGALLTKSGWFTDWTY